MVEDAGTLGYLSRRAEDQVKLEMREKKCVGVNEYRRKEPPVPFDRFRFRF